MICTNNCTVVKSSYILSYAVHNFSPYHYIDDFPVAMAMCSFYSEQNDVYLKHLTLKVCHIDMK